MRGSWLIPTPFRAVNSGNSAEAGWLNRRVTSVLQSVSRRACIHPIHTIVVVALLASTTYVGLLEGSLLDPGRDARHGADQLDVKSLLEGGRNVRLGRQSSWRWQIDDSAPTGDSEVCGLLFDRVIGVPVLIF